MVSSGTPDLGTSPHAQNGSSSRDVNECLREGLVLLGENCAQIDEQATFVNPGNDGWIIEAQT